MEGHDPLTCELCHGEGVSAELVSLRAENARRGTALGAIMTFAAATHPAPCGTDACLLCLIESTAKDALRLARPIDDKQPASPEGLSVGREQECEHCYQDSRCLSEPCPRPPKYPRGYDADADREWDEWEALKATLPSPRQEAADGPC